MPVVTRLAVLLPPALSRQLTRRPLWWLGPVLVLTMIQLASSTVGERGKPTVPGTVWAVAPGQSPGSLFVPAVLHLDARPSPPPVVASDLPVATAADGAMLYLVYHTRIDIIDWTDIHNPRRLSTLPMGYPAEICHVSVRGGLLALVTGQECGQPGDSGASVLRLAVTATPAAPRWAGRVDLSGGETGLAVGDGFTYVALGGAGIAVLDVRDPDRPRLGDSVAIATGRLAMGSGHLFGAPGSNRVNVIDVTDPAHPVLVNSTDPPTYGFTSALVPVGRHVAVGGAFSRQAWVDIWDVADPGDPRPVATVDQHMDTTHNNVAWAGSRLFVGHAEAVAAFDTADVEHPLDLGRLTVPEGVLALANAAEYGLALTRVGTVVAVEVPAGAAPRRVAEYRAPE